MRKPLQASRKKDNDTMTMKFLLYKDKKENGKPSAQKQECGCPALQSSLRSHTHAFFTAHGQHNDNMVMATSRIEAKIKLYLKWTTN
jgi:hypothetical protein